MGADRREFHAIKHPVLAYKTLSFALRKPIFGRRKLSLCPKQSPSLVTAKSEKGSFCQ